MRNSRKSDMPMTNSDCDPCNDCHAVKRHFSLVRNTSMKVQHGLYFRFSTLSRQVIRHLLGSIPRYCAAILCVVMPSVGRAQTLTTLANFLGTNGANPFFAPLLQGTDGNLYGTTSAGGAHGQGTLFKVTPAGTITTIYSFCSKSNCADGSAPYAPLIQATDGNFYGTTFSGGAHNAGTIFRITPNGLLFTLHSFNWSDGADPYAALIQATDGNLYGTTESGGANLLGTVFRITPLGVYSILHSFNSSDGSSPEAALVQAADGNFYSTTYNGGSSDGSYGTVFKITPTGVLTTLHLFDGSDGRAISNGLVLASNGNFYGTASVGGMKGFGTAFMITPGGGFTPLHNFDSTDATPNMLVLATDGNLYGTTFAGNGTVFKITPQGAFTSLHTFSGSDGSGPFAGLTQTTDGKLYGTTTFGGSRNDGTVFRVDVGLHPFVETLPTAGKLGTTVKILGTNLSGATSVTFNGVSAKFTVVSPSLISTTVPTGATTGPMQVITPGGTLTSNVVFQVLQ
jgi:uncharacterized repeat protein (TIGR03803 family)